MTFLEYANGKLPVITMDFDHNLKFETGDPNLDTLKQFKELQNDYDIYIVTTRKKTPESVKEVSDFVKEHSLRIKDVIFTNGQMKLNTILKLESIMHFDDDEDEIEEIEDYNKKNNTSIKTVYTFNKEKWNEYFKSIYDDD